ncbi:hypothetical protein [Paenibacillus anseongense]|uniref:hypothetical protein n=1 Tax=Paenibacillus anseongense TaxID=2682845 RepID=UPI002DBC7E3F|nr:hypothetical protein [Paenibacillus anseongense]MEC0265138.1 hypothetical protein [Paenibacillus anseongense]
MGKLVLNDGLTLFSKVVANTTATINPSSLVDGAGEDSSAITVTGAVFGDLVIVTAPYDSQGLLIQGRVSAADTIKIRFQNETGATVDLASGAYKILVIRF